MEEYNYVELRGNGSGGFLYGRNISSGSRNHHHHHQLPPSSSFHLHSAGDDGALKTQSGTSLNPEGVEEIDALKSKIIAHPHYSNLLQAYMDCLKVGAPAEREFEAWSRSRSRVQPHDSATNDPELDHFMEAYYDMLVKLRVELTRPFEEAMDFIQWKHSQLNLLAAPPPRGISTAPAAAETEGVGSSEEELEIDPEDRELKNHLLNKYGGYISSLKQELSKKKKQIKLPKDARQKLLTWWDLHYKWPYPSESEKVALAETTGLEQKQINNWFINQRKRHWKPSDHMQFMVMGNASACLRNHAHI